MRKISFFIVSGLLLALLVSSVFSAGCQKSSSTSTTDNGSSSQTQKQPPTPEKAHEGDGQKSTAAESATVTIKSDGFDPQDVTVKSGGTITWKNESGHDAQLHIDGGSPGDTFGNGQTHEEKFDTAGSYSYHNHLSSSMSGTITVE